MTDDRLGEIRAMFNDMTEILSATHERTHERKELGHISAIQLHSMALVALATLSSGLVELVDELGRVRSRLDALEVMAHPGGEPK